MNTTRIKQYTRAVAVVRDLPMLLSDNPKIWTGFQYYTKSDYNHVIKLLNSNVLPEIIPVWNLRRNGRSCWGNTPANKASNPQSGTVIEITENLLHGLETAKLKTTIYNTAFLLSTVLLHELVHYIVFINNLPATYEWGDAFEKYSFGSGIDDTNASVYNYYQTSFTHLKWAVRNDKTIINDTVKY